MKLTLKSSSVSLALLALASTSVLAATVYIPEGSAGSVLVVEAETGDVIKRISGLEAIHGLSGAPGVRYLVAGSFQELSREDAAQTNKPVAVSAEDHEAHHAASNKSKSASDDTVSIVTILDTQTEEIVHRIEVPAAVHHTAVSPDGSLAVATHPGSDGISIINLETMKVVGFVATGPTPNYAAFSSDSQRVYVTNTGNSTISEIDVARLFVTRNMIAGDAPEHFVAKSDDSALYVLDGDAGNAYEISIASGKVTRTFEIGGELHGVDLAEDEKTLFVSGKGDNKFVAIDLGTGDSRSIPLSPAPYHVTTVTGTGNVFVSSREEPKVWVVDGKSLVVSKEIPISGEGHQMVVVP